MAALRAVGVRSDSGQDTSCSDLVRLSVEVNQSRAHVGTERCWIKYRRDFVVPMTMGELLLKMQTK